MILKITQGNMKKTEHLVPLILFLPLLRNASWCIVGDIDLSPQRLHKMKVEHKQGLGGRSTDVTGLKALLKRYIFNMTRNSLTKFIKVVWANVGVVFVGVFPKKSQNPKLKQEIQGIS